MTRGGQHRLCTQQLNKLWLVRLAEGKHLQPHRVQGRGIGEEDAHTLDFSLTADVDRGRRAAVLH